MTESSPVVCVLAALPFPSLPGVATAGVPGTAGFVVMAGSAASFAAGPPRGVPGCDDAHEGVVQPLSDSSAAFKSTQSSAPNTHAELHVQQTSRKPTELHCEGRP